MRGPMYADRFVVWDMDGTLIDTLEDIGAAANAARAAFGRDPLPLRTIQEYVGEGAERLINRTMGEQEPEGLRRAAREVFFAHYSRHLCERTRPYPGIDALVRRLRGRQAVATNKPGFMARRIVEQLGWDGLFGAVVGGGDTAERKPSPAPALEALARAGAAVERAVFVGDSRIDLQTARAARMPVILVTWGFRPREELEGADHLAQSPEELARLLGAGVP